jgi:hypothetical protein
MFWLLAPRPALVRDIWHIPLTAVDPPPPATPPITHQNIHKKYITLIYQQHSLSATARLCVEYVHCKQDPIYIFPEMTLCGFVPNFHIRVFVSDFYIFPWSINLFCCRKYVDGSWEYINRSQTHECGNRDWGRAIPRKVIHKWDFRRSAPIPHQNIHKNVTLICRQHPFSATATLCVEYVAL